MNISKRSKKSLRRACLGATLATATLAGGTQQSQAGIVALDYGIQGSITPTIDLDKTYVAAIYNYNSSGIYLETFKIADSISANTTTPYLVDLADDVSAGYSYSVDELGYVFIASYADGIVLSFDDDAAGFVTATQTYDSYTGGTPTEADLQADLDAENYADIETFLSQAVDYYFATNAGQSIDTTSYLVAFSDATDVGSGTGNLVVIPEPVSAAMFGLTGGLLMLRRRG